MSASTRRTSCGTARRSRSATPIVELRTDDFLGANVTIPHKERVVPMVDKLTEEAHATGAVNTLTKEGRKLVGHNTDVPGFKVALDAARRPPEDAAHGDRAGRRRRRAGRRLRPHPRGLPAGHRVQPPPPSRRRGWSSTSGAAPRTWSCGRCRGTSRSSRPSSRRRRCWSTRRRSGSMADDSPLPGRDPQPGAARARPDLREDAAAARRRGGGLRHGRRRDDAAPPGRRRVQPLDRAAGAARGHGRGAGRRTGEGPAVRRGRAGGGRRCGRRATTAAEPAAS